MNTTPTEDTIREICDRLHDAATQEHSLQHRISATIVLIERLTGIEAEVLPVRAVLYSRSAVNRLGGAMMPAHAGEIAHFREQVGPAMILLGIDQPHAVLLAADLMIELADSAQWAQRGVLLHPFVANRPTDLTQWTITGLAIWRDRDIPTPPRPGGVGSPRFYRPKARSRHRDARCNHPRTFATQISHRCPDKRSLCRASTHSVRCMRFTTCPALESDLISAARQRCSCCSHENDPVGVKYCGRTTRSQSRLTLSPGFATTRS